MVVESRLKAADLFGQLKPEEERELKKFEVEKNSTLEAIVKGLDKTIKAKYYGEDEFYRVCKRNLPKRYTAKDIERFSVILADYPSKDTMAMGMYLNALINYSREKHVKIQTPHHKRLRYLGYRNKCKEILIKGDVGDFLGYKMKRGRIIVRGSVEGRVAVDMRGGTINVDGTVGSFVGLFMKAGKVYVKGNAGSFTGVYMRGGEIHIEGDTSGLGHGMRDGVIYVAGNAGSEVGSEMKHGQIYLDGTYESIANDRFGGSIYHKGKLIAGTGKRKSSFVKAIKWLLNLD